MSTPPRRRTRASTRNSSMSATEMDEHATAAQLATIRAGATTALTAPRYNAPASKLDALAVALQQQRTAAALLRSHEQNQAANLPFPSQEAEGFSEIDLENPFHLTSFDMPMMPFIHQPLAPDDRNRDLHKSTSQNAFVPNNSPVLSDVAAAPSSPNRERRTSLVLNAAARLDTGDLRIPAEQTRRKGRGRHAKTTNILLPSEDGGKFSLDATVNFLVDSAIPLAEQHIGPRSPGKQPTSQDERRARNSDAAKRSRLRRELRMDFLENALATLEHKCSALEVENMQLKQDNQRLLARLQLTGAMSLDHSLTQQNRADSEHAQSSLVGPSHQSSPSRRGVKRSANSMY